MAKQFVQWLKKAVVDAYDPQRAERVKQLADKLFNDLKVKQKQFNLQQSIAGLEIAKGELREATENVFCRLLENVWRDGTVSEAEMKTVQWVQHSLAFAEADAIVIRKKYAIDQFRAAYIQAMQDGHLSDDEYANLNRISQTVGESAATFCRELFHQEGESFLQAMFLSCVEDGVLVADEWRTLKETSQRLGIAETEFFQLVEVPAKRFVEHVLADAKADEQLSADERTQIEELLTTLKLDRAFCTYVRNEMDELYWAHEISLGRLPIIQPPPGVELKAGEMVHAHISADLCIVRALKSGPTKDIYKGTVTLLDGRAVFQSPTKAESISYGRIISLRARAKLIDFQLNGKPTWQLLPRDEAPLFSLIFAKAVALANQTATRITEGLPSRHISRDVRRRIWLKYGGQCVDCGAKDYLEFDHIIPVAKGGSNAEANVQLLCRRCNLKKSDHI